VPPGFKLAMAKSFAGHRSGLLPIGMTYRYRIVRAMFAYARHFFDGPANIHTSLIAVGHAQRRNLNEGPSVMTRRPATAREAVLDDSLMKQMPTGPDPPAFDAMQFDALIEMIGEDGAGEMVEIFETETRQRLRRLAGGDLDTAALTREMHTLKGAAATVASPRLTEFGAAFEQSARRGIAPEAGHLKAIEAALDAFLLEVRVWNERRASAPYVAV
jgi:HPt (histidine-containing phosphotransfer) domain-containing protein